MVDLVSALTLIGVPPVSTIVGWAYGSNFRIDTGNYNADGALLSGSITWPNSATGTFTTDAINAEDSSMIDAYTVTHVFGGKTTTLQQPAVTRNADGMIVPPVPALIITE